MAKIILEIKNCSECPKVIYGRRFKSDIWDDGGVYDYNCSITGKIVASWIEYPSQMPQIPDDCPLRLLQ